VTWRDQAVCYNDVNSSYWVSYNLDKVRYAKAGCARCQVVKQCLSSVSDESTIVGVLGGLSEFDRLIISNGVKNG
jgi:hypothetical protein